MAVNYANVFSVAGEFLQRINEYRALFSAIDTDLAEIRADLVTAGREDLGDGLQDQFDGYKLALVGWCEALTANMVEMFTHQDAVLEQLGLNTTDIQTVLAEMFRDMVDNSQTINNSIVVIGSVVEDKANANAGVILTDNKLDGYSTPRTGFQPNREYNLLETEILPTLDTIRITCDRDNPSDNVTEGSEEFTISGNPEPPSGFHWQDEGTGPGESLTCLNGAGIISNGEMESFTSNVPDNWTVETGTAGTHILEETSAIHRGSSSLELAGNASLAEIKLSQALTAGSVNPLRRYCVAAWVRGNASLTQGSLIIQFEDGNDTLVGQADSKIDLDQSELAAQTTFGLEYFYVNFPAELPDTLKLAIRFNGTPSSHNVFVDGVAFGPVTYHGGMNVVAIAGSQKFLRGDRFTFTLTNNNNGVFQTMFRRAFKVQMPSDGSPTIADSYAT